MRRSAIVATALVLVALAGGCADGGEPAATVEDLPELVLQPADVPDLSQAGAGPPRIGGEVQTVDSRAWRVGYRQRSREIDGFFMVDSYAEVLPDEAAAQEAFRRLVRKVDARDLLTGLPTTRVAAPTVGAEARAWTADFEPMTVASVAWRTGNVVSWIALQGPDRDDAVRTAVELAKKQDGRIEAARS